MRFQARVIPQRRREEGVALVLVLLFTAIVLSIIVSTTATLALGARGGGVDERAAYQALLAAESALNTFAVRAQERTTTQPYTGSSASDLATWLDNLKTYSSGSSSTASLTFEKLSSTPGGSTLTVIAHGQAAGATKAVLQDYRLTPANLPKTFRSRAALTSLPAINANGSADIDGRANDGIVTRVQGSALSLPVLSTTVTLPVDDTTGVLAGDYVKVSGATFRVDSKDSTSLNLTRVSAAGSASLSLSGDVTLMLNAVAGSYISLSDPSTVKVSNYSDFIVGETVTVAGKTGKISQIDVNNKSVQIKWTSGIPSGLAEGTQVFRDVTAMRSAGEIDVKQNKLEAYSMNSGDQTRNDCTSATICSGENDALLQHADNAPFFTQQLLGLSDQELDNRVPLSRPPFTMNNQIKRIKAEDFDEAIKNSNSSGVLIVDGDINSNVNGNTTFNGLIYFRGNQGGKFNGNLTVNGAIAVRGGPIEGITSKDDVTTDITGNLTVDYDAVKLRQHIFNATGAPKVETVASTWRQR